MMANWISGIKTSVHGCIDDEGRLITSEEDTANTETFCRFLDKVANDNPEYQVFMMLIDRAKYHTNDKVREHIYELRSHARNFKLIWLPRYSPELSPIEQLWKPFKREVHNRIITTKQKLLSVVKGEVAALSTTRKGLLSKYFPVLFR
jgi:transposase